MDCFHTQFSYFPYGYQNSPTTPFLTWSEYIYAKQKTDPYRSVFISCSLI